MKGDGDVRIFVALFPYDPATMSPNPDAAEEELPFSEGQIIKVSSFSLFSAFTVLCFRYIVTLFLAGLRR